MSFILNFPLWLSFSLILIFSVIISYTGLHLVHKKYSYELLKESHNLSSYLFNGFGLLYAVVVAFVIYINWTEYNEAQNQWYLELNELSNIFHNVQGFEETQKQEFMKEIIAYTSSLTYEDYNSMRENKISLNTKKEYDKLWSLFLNMDLSKNKNPELYNICLQELNKVSEARRLRYFYMNNKIPAIIWVTLFSGCIISILFTFLFGFKHKYPYIISIISFTFVNIFMLYLIYVLDHPFEGKSGLTNDNAIEILRHFETVLKGSIP